MGKARNISFVSETETLTFINKELKYKRRISINKCTGMVKIVDIDTINNQIVNKIVCDVFILDKMHFDEYDK